MAIANYKSFITRLGKMICKNFTDSKFIKTEFDDEFNSNTAYFTINGYSAWACIYDDDDIITVYVASTHTVEIKIDGTQKDAMATAVRRIESLLDEAEIKKAEIDKKAEEEVNADKQEAAERETAKQYFVVNYEKDGIFHANLVSAEKKSDVEAKYSEYDAFVVVEANDYIVEEAKIKHMPIIEVEPVKQEGRNTMESVKPLSMKVERAISKMALGDCTLTGVTELSDYCHDIYVTIETGKDRYELKVIIMHNNIDGVTTIAIVEDEADEATHVFTDRGCMSLDTIAYRTKTLVEGMYAQRMFDMPCEITDPEYFKEHQGDIEEQIEEKEEEAEEPQPTPEEADREVTYIDFKPEQDYEEERPPHAAFEQLRKDSIEPPKIWSCKALKVQEILQKIYEGKTKTSGERLYAYYNHCINLILVSRIFLPECMCHYLERKLSNEMVITGVCPAVIEEAFGYKKTRRKWYWKL